MPAFPAARLRGAPRRYPAGVSLMELIVVIVIMGVMLALAAPGLREMRDKMRLDGAAQQVAGDLRRMQVEAIKRNRSLRLVRSGETSYTVDSLGTMTLEDGVKFTSESATELRLASFGPPVGGGATFVVTYASRQKTIIVSPAGMLTVQ